MRNGNPLARLSHGTSTPESMGPRTNFAEVTSTSPLQIRLAGDDIALEGSPPVSLVSGLKVGHIVRVEFHGQELIITGRVDGTPTDTAKRMDLPPWRTPGLLNSWESYTSFGVVQYRRVGDEVQMRGVARLGAAGAATPIFYVDADCAPPGTSLNRATNGTVAIDLRVNTAGAVYVQSPTSGLGWVSLEGVRYFT